MLDLAGKAEFLGRLRNGARRQVEINLVNHLAQVTFHVRHNDRAGQLLPVSLIPAVVLDLNV